MRRPILRLLAAFAAAFVFAVSLPGCGGDDTPSGPGSGNEILNQLHFAYEGGDSLAVGSAHIVCCGDWEEGAGTPTLKVFFYDPDMARASWKLFLVLDRVTAGTDYSLPQASTGQDRALQIFVFDAPTGNELSSDLDEASGTIRVETVDCGPPLRISFTLTDVVLPSELHNLPALRVSGDFEATVTDTSGSCGCRFGI